MTILLTIAFWVSLCGTGFVIGAYWLKLRNAVGLGGCAVIAGTALYLFAVNTLGYVMPIRSAFWAGHVLLLLATEVTLSIAWKHHALRLRGKEMILPPRGVTWVLIAVILFAGLAFARDRGSDEWTTIHFALPATIMEGNFPVMDVGNPWNFSSYHYGPVLLVAALSSVTGMTLASAHSFLPVLSAASIILFAATLAWELLRSWRAAALCAVLALGTSGFFWLRGDLLIRDLMDVYLLHKSLAPEGQTAFRNFADMIRDLHAGSLLMMLGHRPTAVGAAFLWPFLFVFQQVLGQASRGRVIAFIAVAILLGAQMALSIELTLVLLGAAVGAYGAYLGVEALLHSRQRPLFWKFVVTAILIFVPVVLIALKQGGVLSNPLAATSTSAFAWNFTGRMVTGFLDAGFRTVAPWSWEFFRDFSPALICLVIALIYAWRRRHRSSYVLFLCVVAGALLTVTWVLTYKPFPANTFRAAFNGNSIVGFLIGIVAYDLFFSRKMKGRGWKLLAGGWIAALLLSSTLHVSTRLLFPDLRFHMSPLFPAMPEITQEEKDLYAWIRMHTTQKDWFYVYFGKNMGREIDHRMIRDRLLISIYTGRYAFNAGETVDPTPEEMKLFVALGERCDANAFSTLGARYNALTHEEQEAWFTKNCRKADWKLVYGAEGSLPRVYERTGVPSPR